MIILFPSSDIGLHYTLYRLLISTFSNPHLLKESKDSLIFDSNWLGIAPCCTCFLPPFLFPPRGKSFDFTPSPVGEGWEGGSNGLKKNMLKFTGLVLNLLFFCSMFLIQIHMIQQLRMKNI
jgi:hypothetical protein